MQQLITAFSQPLVALCVLTLLLLAALAGWLWSAARGRRQLLTQQLLQQTKTTELESERQHLQQQLARSNEQAQQQRQQLDDKLERRSEELTDVRQRFAALEARMQSEQRSFIQQIERLESAESRLGDTFKRLAGEIFEQKNQSFTELSKSRLNTLLNPLNTQIKDFAELVRDVSSKGSTQHGQLQQQLIDLQKLNQSLTREASQLVDALRGSNKLIGNWGELQLEKLLQLAGLKKDREYRTQITLKSEQGTTLRPDAQIMLPDNKSIIIDAKMSLEHYTQAHNAEDDLLRDEYLKKHCLSVKKHIKELAEKGYASVAELDTPDFVLMFIPIEAALQEALHAEPEILDFAVRHNVALVAPTNLLTTLRTVSSLWQAWRQNENAREIGDRAGKLHDKFVGFVDNLKAVGERLGQAQTSYDSAFRQLSEGPGNLVRQASQLRELGAKTSKVLSIASDADEDDGDADDGTKLEQRE